jgi:hypothetical protein
MRDDGMEDFRNDDGPGRNIVNAVQQLFHLGGSQEEAVEFVVGPMDRHSQIMKERGHGYGHLGVFDGKIVVGGDTGLDVMLDKSPEKSERDVSDNLEMNRAMIAHAQPLNGIDIHHLPQGIKFIVSVDTIYDLLESWIVAGWNTD